MAFKVRCEFWRLSTTGDGVATVLIDEAVADALEIVADTDPVVDLPVSPGSYAMAVEGMIGSATVEVANTPTEDPARGKLVREDTQAWFIVKPGDKLYVEEYVEA